MEDKQENYAADSRFCDQEFMPSGIISEHIIWKGFPYKGDQIPLTKPELNFLCRIIEKLLDEIIREFDEYNALRFSKFAQAHGPIEKITISPFDEIKSLFSNA